VDKFICSSLITFNWPKPLVFTKCCWWLC